MSQSPTTPLRWPAGTEGRERQDAAILHSLTVDVEVANHGSLFTFDLRTVKARAWWIANVGDNSEWREVKAVEHRYAYDLVQGMLDDGLVVQ